MRQLNLNFAFCTALITLSALNNASANSSEELLSISDPGQEQIVRMLEEDFQFESQKKQLSNQLALEKLRNELNRLKAENEPVKQLPSSPSVGSAEANFPIVTVQPPSVLLVSEVAGLPRILVKDSDAIKLRKPSDIFTSSNGKKYKFISQGSQKFILKEIN
ncbi:lngG [Escherichia coli]|uniref:lngG n=1 Tax=Escherichia coli TaxID=562 RepID=UPI0038B40E4B